MPLKAGYKPGRWNMEDTHAWFNQSLELIARHDKTTASYEAPLQLAAAVIVYMKIGIITG